MQCWLRLCVPMPEVAGKEGQGRRLHNSRATSTGPGTYRYKENSGRLIMKAVALVAPAACTGHPRQADTQGRRPGDEQCATTRCQQVSAPPVGCPYHGTRITSDTIYWQLLCDPQTAILDHIWEQSVSALSACASPFVVTNFCALVSTMKSSGVTHGSSGCRS